MIIFRSTTILTVILFLCLCNAQDARSMQGAFGAVTIDGKVWNQIALRPVVPIGNLRLLLISYFILTKMVIFIKTNGIFQVLRIQKIRLLTRFITFVTD